MKSTDGAPTDRRLANLAPPWQPGQSGNPAGLPPGTVSLRAIMRVKLAELAPGEDRRTVAEKLVDSTLLDALAGDPAARRLIWEYLEGKPTQAVAVADLTVAGLGARIEDYTAEALALVSDTDLDAEIARLQDEIEGNSAEERAVAILESAGYEVIPPAEPVDP